MKNFKKQHWAFCIIFCVFLISVFSCAQEARIERKVDALLKAEDYNSALEILDESIKQNPEKPYLRALKVKVLAKMGEHIDAGQEYLKFYNFTEKHAPELLHEIAFGYFANKHGDDLDRTNFDFALRLADVGDNSGVGILKEALDDEDEDIRYDAVKALAKLGDENGMALLKEALDDEDEDIRYDAAKALSRLGDKSGIGILKKVLKDGGSFLDVRLPAAEALARLGDNTGTDYLKGKHFRGPGPSWVLQETKDRYVRILAETKLRDAEALARLGDENGMALLKEALNDEDVMIRSMALVALVRLGDKKIIPVIMEKLNKTTRERDLIFLVLCLYKLTK